MDKLDKELLEIYMCGFKDELCAKISISQPDKLRQIAYEYGRLDAIVGDDVSSSDEQSDIKILTKIKRNDTDI